ncbi:MAG: hypothetical protein JSW37_13025, partial [Anaerolineales bacterium]
AEGPNACTQAVERHCGQPSEKVYVPSRVSTLSGVVIEAAMLVVVVGRFPALSLLPPRPQRDWGATGLPTAPESPA